MIAMSLAMFGGANYQQLFADSGEQPRFRVVGRNHASEHLIDRVDIEIHDKFSLDRDFPAFLYGTSRLSLFVYGQTGIQLFLREKGIICPRLLSLSICFVEPAGTGDIVASLSEFLRRNNTIEHLAITSAKQDHDDDLNIEGLQLSRLTRLRHLEINCNFTPGSFSKALDALNLERLAIRNMRGARRSILKKEDVIAISQQLFLTEVSFRSTIDRSSEISALQANNRLRRIAIADAVIDDIDYGGNAVELSFESCAFDADAVVKLKSLTHLETLVMEACTIPDTRLDVGRLLPTSAKHFYISTSQPSQAIARLIRECTISGLDVWVRADTVSNISQIEHGKLSGLWLTPCHGSEFRRSIQNVRSIENLSVLIDGSLTLEPERALQPAGLKTLCVWVYGKIPKEAEKRFPVVNTVVDLKVNDISGNSMGVLRLFLSSCPSVQTLIVENYTLTDIDKAAICGANQLRCLVVKECRVPIKVLEPSLLNQLSKAVLINNVWIETAGCDVSADGVVELFMDAKRCKNLFVEDSTLSRDMIERLYKTHHFNALSVISLNSIIADAKDVTSEKFLISNWLAFDAINSDNTLFLPMEVRFAENEWDEPK